MDMNKLSPEETVKLKKHLDLLKAYFIDRKPTYMVGVRSRASDPRTSAYGISLLEEVKREAEHKLIHEAKKISEFYAPDSRMLSGDMRHTILPSLGGGSEIDSVLILHRVNK